MIYFDIIGAFNGALQLFQDLLGVNPVAAPGATEPSEAIGYPANSTIFHSPSGSLHQFTA